MSPASSATSSVDQRDVSNSAPISIIAGPNSPFMTVGEDSAPVIARPSSAQADQLLTSASASSAGADQQGTSLTNRRSPTQSSQTSNQDRVGSSDLQSFSESLKSRVGAWSMKCKESITKSTKGWKEKLFNRNSSIPDPSPEVHREVDQVIAPEVQRTQLLQICPLPTKLVLRKKRAKDGKTSEEVEHFPVPKSVTIRRRPKVAAMELRDEGNIAGSKDTTLPSRNQRPGQCWSVCVGSATIIFLLLLRFTLPSGCS